MTKTTQEIFDFDLPAAMSGGDFIISDNNREAIEWLAKHSEWSVPAFIIYGAPACGKSHVCQIWQELTGAVKVTANNLDSEAWLENLQPNGFYVIDDLDLILAGAEMRQKSVFHLYNFLFNEGGRVLVTSTVAPKDIDLALADLQSRLRGAPAVAIGEPDDGTLHALFVKMFDDRQVNIKPEVIDFITPRIERSYKAVRDTVTDLDGLSLKGKRAITIPLVREWLAAKKS